MFGSAHRFFPDTFSGIPTGDAWGTIWYAWDRIQVDFTQGKCLFTVLTILFLKRSSTILSFLQNNLTSFYMGWTRRCTHQKWIRISFSPHHNTDCFQDFFYVLFLYGLNQKIPTKSTHQKWIRIQFSPHHHQHRLFSGFFLCYSDLCEIISHCHLDLDFINKRWWSLFIYLWPCIYLLPRSVFSFSFPIFDRLCLLLLFFVSSLCILDIKLLSDVLSPNIFTPSDGCFFVLVCISFVMETFFS